MNILLIILAGVAFIPIIIGVFVLSIGIVSFILLGLFLIVAYIIDKFINKLNKK